MLVPFTFRVQLGVSQNAPAEAIREAAADLQNAFRSYGPKIAGPFVLFESTPDYRLGLALSEWTRKQRLRCGVIELGNWDIDALIHARYLPLYVVTGIAGGIDYDRNAAPLNLPP